jgi:hypothetical protein
MSDPIELLLAALCGGMVVIIIVTIFLDLKK